MWASPPGPLKTNYTLLIRTAFTVNIKSLIIAICCLCLTEGTIDAAQPVHKGSKARTSAAANKKASTPTPFYISTLCDGLYNVAYSKDNTFVNLTYGILDSKGKLIRKFSQAPTVMITATDTIIITDDDSGTTWTKLNGSVVKKFPGMLTMPIGDGLLTCQKLNDYESCSVINDKGETVIPFTRGVGFDNAADGVIVASKGDRFGLISKDGKQLCDFIYDCIGKPKNGWVAVLKDEKTGFIDYKGNVLVPFRYDYNEYWGDDDSDPLPMYAVDGVGIASKNDLWGAVDSKGNVVIPFKYQNAGIGSKGTIVMYTNEMEYYFDSKGNSKGHLQKKGSTYGDVDDLHVYENPVTNKSGFVDNTGRIVIQPVYQIVCEFNGDTALVKQGGVWCLIDRSGKIVKRNVARHWIGELVG